MKQRWDKIILNELSAAFDALDETQVETLIDELLKPGRRVLCVGVGRVLISMKAWVKRLRHMNIDLNFVGAESEEPIGKGDLLIVASASGESLFPVAIARKAARRDRALSRLHADKLRGRACGSSRDPARQNKVHAGVRSRFDPADVHPF